MSLDDVIDAAGSRYRHENGGFRPKALREISTRMARKATPYARPVSDRARGIGEISLYVGNLAYDVRWQDLKDHCKIAGEVLHTDVVLGNDGRSKGWYVFHKLFS